MGESLSKLSGADDGYLHYRKISWRGMACLSTNSGSDFLWMTRMSWYWMVLSSFVRRIWSMVR